MPGAPAARWSGVAWGRAASRHAPHVQGVAASSASTSWLVQEVVARIGLEEEIDLQRCAITFIFYLNINRVIFGVLDCSRRGQNLRI